VLRFITIVVTINVYVTHVRSHAEFLLCVVAFTLIYRNWANISTYLFPGNKFGVRKKKPIPSFPDYDFLENL
jgi:hypothetical protein